jgi:sugar lactone lactonase YvrE
MNSKLQLTLCVLAVLICAAIGTTDLVNAANNVIVTPPGTYTFPAQTVGVASASVSIPVTISSGDALSQIKVLTQGTTGLDFQQTGTTCLIGSAYSIGLTCTVNVVFTPKAPGLRSGAVVLYGANMEVMGITYISGVGNGGLLNLLGGQISIASIHTPEYLGLDAAGDVFVWAPAQSTQVLKFPAGGGATTALGTGLGNISAIAVDGAGNVYLADFSNHCVFVVPPNAGNTQTTVGAGLTNPSGLVIDGAGNLYISDSANNDVIKVLAGGSTEVTVASGLSQPQGLALDSAGNLYIADTGNNRVVKIAAAGGLQSTVGTGLSQPTQVAADAAGDLYIEEPYSNQVVVVSSTGGAQTTIGTGLNQPFGLAIDQFGNVFIGDYGNSRILEVQQSASPTLSFGNVTVGSSNSIGLEIGNLGNVPLTLSTAISATGVSAANQYSASGSCATIAVGANCTIPVIFRPTTGSPSPGTPETASLTLADNAPSLTQSIPLTGIAIDNPTQLQFSALPPANLEAGTNAGFVSVNLEDPLNNLVPSASGTVTLRVSGPSGYSQSYTAGTDGGIATFDLSSAVLSAPGTYAYIATSGVLASATATEIVLPLAYTVTVEPLGVTSPATTVTLASNLSGVEGTSATVGSIKVVTQGATGLDFQQATGGTCAVGTTYTFGQSCTVNVTFTPKGVGQRSGAVLLYDNSPTPVLLASAYLSAIGNGGLPNFSSGVVTNVSSGTTLSLPTGIAVDVMGNIYVAQTEIGSVTEIPSGGGAPTTIATELSGPLGVAVDGAGNVYISDRVGLGRIQEIPAGGGASVTIPPPVGLYDNLSEIAVDGAGNIYAADSQDAEIVERLANGTFQYTPLAFFPYGVAVDSAGNIYAAGNGEGGPSVVKISGGKQTSIGSGFSAPSGVAVDGGGNLYITDQTNNAVYMVPAGGGPQVTIASGLSSPTGITVDGLGNVYIVDSGNSRVVKISQTQLPSSPLNLGRVSVGGSPGTASLSFTNIGNAVLTMASAVTPAAYQESDGCGGSVATNATCTLNLKFAPTTGSASPGTVIPGTLTLTDNAPSSPQAISLTGTGLLTAPTAAAAPETEIYGQPFSASVTFTGITVGAPTGTITFTAAEKTICTFTGTLSATTTCSAPNSGFAVGTYPVTFTYTGDSHYLSATGTSSLTVTKAALAVTANGASRVYGAANPSFGVTITGLANGDTTSAYSGSPLVTTTATAASAVGKYPITPTLGTLAATNYTFAFVNGTLTVNTAVLTVTANDASRFLGTANPIFTSAITGFVNGDTLASAVTGSPLLTTTATAASPAGKYPITPALGTLIAPNYTFTFVNGTLTVQPATLTITAPSEVAVIPTPTNTFPEVLTYSGLTGLIPTGTVTFSIGSATPCTTSLNGTSLSGTITCAATTNGLTAGTTPTVTYVYSGDANYVGSTGTVSLAVSAAPMGAFPGGSTTFSTTIAVPAQAVGASVTFQCLYVTPVINGVFQSQELASQAGISCTPSPQTITLAANTPVTINISTTASATAFLRHSTTGSLGTLCLLIPGFGLVGLGTVLRGRRRRGTEWILIILVGFVSVGLVACGGHFTPPAISSGTTTNGGNPTPAGLYLVNITPEQVNGTTVPPSFAQTSLIVPITVVATSH